MDKTISIKGNNGFETLINLDGVIGQFNSWQKHISETSKSNITLQDEVTNLKKLLENNQEYQQQVEHDLHINKNLIETLQATLAKRCDLEDENRKLQEDIVKLQVDSLNDKKDAEQKILELEKAITDQQHDQNYKLKDLEETFKKKALTEKEASEKIITDKSAEIISLHQKITNIEKDHQAQVFQVRMECDSKLMKLQKQNTKAQQSANSAVNQDIFRKKLQHAKAESEKEIACLNRTISDLRQRISSLEQKSGSQYATSTKKRRF